MNSQEKVVYTLLNIGSLFFLLSPKIPSLEDSEIAFLCPTALNFSVIFILKLFHFNSLPFSVFRGLFLTSERRA